MRFHVTYERTHTKRKLLPRVPEVSPKFFRIHTKINTFSAKFTCKRVIEPDIQHDPGITPPGRLEARAQRCHDRMSVGEAINSAMQGDTIAQTRRHRRIGTATDEIAHQPAHLQRHFTRGQPGMGQMIHAGHRPGLTPNTTAAVIMRIMNDSEFASAPDIFPGEAASFALSGPAGKLEVATDVADPPGCAATAVICHPHPMHGGTMRNKVVTIIERSLREVGLNTVRFNFRGVGASDGSYDDGVGEGDDLAAVVEWVRRASAGDDIWLAGFSFGSYVALRNAHRLGATALVTIAPPVGRWDFECFTMPTCPWLAVQGEDDEVVDAQAVFDWVASLEHAPHMVRMPDTSHFFHRRLMDLRGVIKNGVRSWLPAPRAG